MIPNPSATQTNFLKYICMHVMHTLQFLSVWQNVGRMVGKNNLQYHAMIKRYVNYWTAERNQSFCKTNF